MQFGSSEYSQIKAENKDVFKNFVQEISCKLKKFHILGLLFSVISVGMWMLVNYFGHVFNMFIKKGHNGILLNAYSFW